MLRTAMATSNLTSQIESLVMEGSAPRTRFSEAETAEIRGLLDQLPSARRAAQRLSMARLRRMGLSIAADPEVQPTRAQFEDLVSSGNLKVNQEAARAKILPHPSGNVFRVAVGVASDPISETWDAFEQRYQWFGRRPQSVTSGAHLFVLAVDRWRSAVVGLYEAVSAGADRLPNSPNPERWPWALGVRPLAAVPPLLAERVDGQVGPQSGLPAHISDKDAQGRLYAAVAASPPPPGPRTPEQRVQELEWRDVIPDVVGAVQGLGREARESAVIARAIEIGAWNGEELKARAWYTGGGIDSHIEHIVRRALQLETGTKGRFDRVHGVYSLTADVPTSGFGVAYRPAGKDPAANEEPPEHLVDLAELDRATERHMNLQDRLAEALCNRGIEPRSPGSWQPQFDLAFEHMGRRFVVEVKSGDPVSAQQVRLGTGQLLEYRHLLQDANSEVVRAVLLIEAEPPDPWASVAEAVGIKLLRADQLGESLAALLSGVNSPVTGTPAADARGTAPPEAG